MKIRFALAFASAIAILAHAQGAQADLLKFGSTFNITGTDFAAGDFNETITFSKSAQTFDNGGLAITEKTTSLGPNSEFAEFYISTKSGGLLVSNGSTNNGEFSIFLNNVPLTQTAISSNYYFDFTTGGLPNTGITGGGGIQVEANPNPGSVGAGQNAFYFPGTIASTAATTGYGQLEYPFDYESSSSVFNTDPNATGYVLGIQLTAVSSVPPLPMFGSAIMGLGVIGYRLKRKRATA